MLPNNCDTQKIQYLKIKKENGQEFIKLINREFKNDQIIDRKYKIFIENDFILFPLIDNEDKINRMKNVIDKKTQFEVIQKKGLPNHKFKYRSIQEALKDKISNDFINIIPRSYDIIGDIAIIEFNKFEHTYNEKIRFLKKEIAKAIMEVNRNVNSVYEKKGEITGKYRLRNLNLLYGDRNSETTYKENKCYFKLDVKNTFFSPRLVYERRRIASSDIKENETIIDLFAGVGPFSIQIAKKHNVEIYSFDLNPDAYYYLKKNIELNNLRGKIHAYNLDVKTLLNPVDELSKKLQNSADRIIVNLPEISLHFIDVICFLMKNTGGIIHYYHFSEKPNPIQKAIELLSINIAKENWKIEKILKSKIVKAFSPKSDLIVLDLVIKALMN